MTAFSATPKAIFLGGDGVHYRERRPPSQLTPWVAVFWHLRVERAHALRVLPDGCMDLIGGDVVGSLSSALIAQLEPGDESFGVRFTPGGFPALYGVPASELCDLRVPLDEVVKRRPLLELARDAPAPDPLARAALAARDTRALATDSGYSPRQLQRRLVAATGHPPKRLMRIARMQALLDGGRGESWARTAIEFDYHDESHMISDIRELAGATPAAMLRDLPAAADILSSDPAQNHRDSVSHDRPEYL